jgi:hypothetical protein
VWPRLPQAARPATKTQYFARGPLYSVLAKFTRLSTPTCIAAGAALGALPGTEH